MTLSERIAAYKEVLNAFLNSGPDIQADLESLRNVINEIVAMYGRSSRRFGFSASQHADILGETQWQEIRRDSEVQSLEAKVKSLVPSDHVTPDHVFGSGAESTTIKGGPLLDVIQQLMTLISSNPALMQIFIQLITTLFKKPVTA